MEPEIVRLIVLFWLSISSLITSESANSDATNLWTLFSIIDCYTICFAENILGIVNDNMAIIKKNTFLVGKRKKLVE